MNPFLKAKEIVLQKYSDQNSFYYLYVLSLYGLLKKYPQQVDMIQELFYQTDIFIEEEAISKILENHNITCFDYEEEENGCNTIYGISTHNHNFIMDDDGSISFQQENPFIICSLKECNPTILMNTFIHEFLHLMKSHRNGYSYSNEKEDFSYSIRCGIAFYDYSYNHKEDTLSSFEYFDTFDEAINVIETTEVMEEILSLKEILEEKEVLDYFSSLDEEEMKKDSGYEEAVLIVRKLWEMDSFKNNIEDNIFDGNIDKIIDSFDSFTYSGAFEDLADLIDKIDLLTGVSKRNKKLITYQKKVRDIIFQYQSQMFTKKK